MVTDFRLVHDPAVHKLGKGPVKTDPRTFKLARYLTDELAPPPSKLDPPGIAEWPMFGNDSYGDCVLAGAGHEEQVVTFDAGKMLVPSLADVLHAYTAVTGFNPDDPSTDRGTVVLDALNWRRKVGLGGRKIAAFAQIDPQSKTEFKQSIALFRIVGLGVALPASAQRQEVWDVARGPDAEPGSWGGHYVPAIAYDAKHVVVVTWGALKLMTWRFLAHYCDEAYAILSPDLLNAGKSPDGFDLATLNHDLHALAA